LNLVQEREAIAERCSILFLQPSSVESFHISNAYAKDLFQITPFIHASRAGSCCTVFDFSRGNIGTDTEAWCSSRPSILNVFQDLYNAISRWEI